MYQKIIANLTTSILILLSITCLALFIKTQCPNQFHDRSDAKGYFLPYYQKQTQATSASQPNRSLTTPLHKQTIQHLHHLSTTQQLSIPQLNYNGPLFNWLWSPLAFLPQPTAAPLWFYISLLSYVLGVALLVKTLPIPISRTLPLSLIFILTLPSTTHSMRLGQVGGITALCVGALIWLTTRYHCKLGSVFLGIITAFKYFFALVAIQHCLDRRWHLLAYTGVGLGLAIAVPVLLTDSPHLSQHLLALSGNNLVAILAKTSNTLNTSLFAMLARPWVPNFGPQMLSIQSLIMVYLTTALCLLGGCLLLQMRTLTTSCTVPSPMRNIAILSLLAIILFPLNWPYYAPCAWPAMLMVLLSLHQRRHPTRTAVFFHLLVLGACFPTTTINFAAPWSQSNSHLLYAFKNISNFWISYGPGCSQISLLWLMLTTPIQITQPTTTTDQLHRTINTFILCITPLYGWVIYNTLLAN